MRKRLCLIAALASLVLFAYAGTASAATLGITSQPSGSTPGLCSTAPSPVIGQIAQDPGNPYFVPSGGGTLTQWQTIISPLDAAGAPIEFVVLRPTSGGNYTVVAVDSRTLPNPLPAVGAVATFPLSTPIPVSAGDTLALYSTSSSAACYFFGSPSIPASDVIGTIAFGTLPPVPGETSTGSLPGGPAVVDVRATLVPPLEDAAVTTTAGPSGASAGHVALLSSTVTNNGPGTTPITFTDVVPSGMTIDFAGAGNGTCSSSGQTVTCTISGLSGGQSAPVAVVVTPSSPGSYTNHVAVAPPAGITDPNPLNNSASATLNVGLSLPAKCVVPKLKGIASGTARTLLKDLGCKVKTSKSHSKSIQKGSVVKSKPGSGTYAYQKTITLVVSSGPKKHK